MPRRAQRGDCQSSVFMMRATRAKLDFLTSPYEQRKKRGRGENKMQERLFTCHCHRDPVRVGG